MFIYLILLLFLKLLKCNKLFKKHLIWISFQGCISHFHLTQCTKINNTKTKNVIKNYVDIKNVNY